MRILFDDDHGCRVAMECTSVCALKDDDSGGWAVVASGDRDVIVRAGLTEDEAKKAVWRLFDVGSWTSWTHRGQ